MKKKILIIMPSLFIGGAERSLLGLLEAFDYDKVDVSLFLYRHEGEFMRYIPQQVHLLPKMDSYETFDVPIKSLVFSRKILFGCMRLVSKIACKLHCKLKREQQGVWMSMQYTSRFLQPLLPKIPGKYDLGIMFLGVADTLINKVDAKKKLTWCHTDYDTLHPNKKLDLQTYSKTYVLVGVSEKCTEKIVAVYPMLKNKVVTIENIIATQFIKTQACELIESIKRDTDEIVILSIGRFCEAKNFDNVPFICKYIRDMGVNVKWYLIGYGADEEIIVNKIKELDVQEYVIILGKKENPYPYIAACDIYVQPSRYEGKSVTVREAQILHKPVVITNYATAESQLKNGVDGIIVPLENKECAKQIVELIQDKQLQNRLVENTKKYDYSNIFEIQKIYDLI